MPVVLYARGYRFWFYAVDLDEPAHVHVGKNGKRAKYWLAPVRLASQSGFRNHELGDIERILRDEGAFILAIWQTEARKRDHGQS
jgi:hypothetical protein